MDKEKEKEKLKNSYLLRTKDFIGICLTQNGAGRTDEECEQEGWYISAEDLITGKGRPRFVRKGDRFPVNSQGNNDSWIPAPSPDF